MNFSSLHAYRTVAQKDKECNLLKAKMGEKNQARSQWFGKKFEL